MAAAMNVKLKPREGLDARRIKRATDRATFKNLGHAGAAIRMAARRSIRNSPKKSIAGKPPHTRKGRLRNAIKYAVSKSPASVVIGPDVEVAGTSGKAHEFGGRYRQETYDKRPFMGPALEKVKDRLPAFWAGSVKG